MFTEKFDYLYVEPSTYCSLECPRCPRTYSKGAYALKHLDTEVFQKVVSSPVFKNVRYIEFGGNYGDPIFHPRLNELIQVAKSEAPQAHFIIHTSGNREPAWWETFIENLSNSDTVLLSIDGLQDSNHLYRKKSKWEWIESALDICSGRVHLVWKYIVFAHNQHQIQDAISFAKEKGVDDFVITKSHLFNGVWQENGVDTLAPSKSWIASPGSNQSDQIYAKCQTSSRHYLSADGFLSPCCWMDFSRQNSVSVQSTIANNEDLISIFTSESFMQLKNSWPINPHKTCQSKCSHKMDSGGRSSHNQLTLSLHNSLQELNKKFEEFSAG